MSSRNSEGLNLRLLAQIEHALALVVEGTVDRLFRAPIHPVQLMRALDEAMEDGVLVQGDHALVPNEYTVSVDRQSYARFAGAQDRLERDCEQHLLEMARRRQYRFVASPVVEFELDPSLRERSYVINAAFSLEDPSPSPATPAESDSDAGSTIVMPSVRAAAWMLEIQSTDEEGRFLPLTSDRYALGRDEDNDIRLTERAASRHHAELLRAGGDFEVRDLQSTNGLSVNGQRVESARLADGDVLLIGTTQLVMRRR